MGVMTALIAWGSLRAEIRMGEPVEYPHAGIAIAVPEGFTPQVLEEPFDVMRAVRMEGKEPVQAVSLSAVPVAKDATADKIAVEMFAERKSNLAIRHLTLKKKVSTMKVAGTTGTGCILEYTFRGIKTAAAEVYFTRDLPAAGVRLCYVLSVETPLDRQAEVIPLLGEVMKKNALRMIPFRRPVDIPIVTLGKSCHDHRHGFCIRPPRGWYVEEIPAGMKMAQTDYSLVGGRSMPTIHVTARDLAGEPCNVTEVRKRVSSARKLLSGCNVTGEGDTKLAGLQARQFILQTAAPKRPATQPFAPTGKPAGKDRPGPAGANPAMVTIVQRVLCVPRRKDRSAASYVVALLAQDVQVDKLEAMMETICGGFTLMYPPPTTAPAGEPAAKTADSAKKK